MLDKLSLFKSAERNEAWDVLKSSNIIKWVLQKVKDILENHWEYNEKIEYLSKEILTRAMMLDILFNDLFEEDALYYIIPAIWVFFNWYPIFLNSNYVRALWSENIEELKKEIMEGKSLERYTLESKKNAKIAVLKLKFWKGYKDLQLKTNDWRIISWNSFWRSEWFEIRIWNDVTYWRFKKTDLDFSLDSSITENISLKSRQIIESYVIEVQKIINLDNGLKDRLIVFSKLLEILDRVWNDWQCLMNITTYNENDNINHNYSIEICNENYLQALWLTYEELRKKIKNGTFYRDNYSKINQKLIEWLMKTLKEDKYYIHDFTMIDSNWVPKNYSWFRLLLVDRDLLLSRTFWIWNNAISADNVELMKILNWN